MLLLTWDWQPCSTDPFHLHKHVLTRARCWPQQQPILWADHCASQGHRWACGAKEANSIRNGQRWEQLGWEVSWLALEVPSNSLSAGPAPVALTPALPSPGQGLCQQNQAEHHQSTVPFVIQNQLWFLHSLLSKTTRRESRAASQGIRNPSAAQHSVKQNPELACWFYSYVSAQCYC